MTDWINICPSLYIQNLCIYDNLNLPLPKDDKKTPSFACCSYAGPIAIAQQMETPNSSTVNVFMQNGTQIASISASALFGLFWSRCQKLLLVSLNGRVLVYDALGKMINAFSMGEETLALGVLDAKTFDYANETGLVVLNNSRHIFAVNSINTPVLWRVKLNPVDTPILNILTCWNIVTQAPKPVKMLFYSGTRFFLGQQESNDGLQQCSFLWAKRDGQYLKIDSSRKSKLLLLHDSNLVQLVDVQDDFQTLLREVHLDKQLAGHFEQILWCSETSFAIWAKSIMADNTDLGIYSLVMGQADQLESPKMNEDECAPCYIFTFRSPVHFFHDLDGIRAFTRNAVHTIQPVCAQSKAVLGLGSNEPGAILFNAYLKLEQRSYVAYEFIRSISAENMLKAVDDCLAAAAHNFDPKMQKKLLKAASMGLHRCDRPYDSDKLMSTNRQLRVLNALRMLGIPLTIEQMHQLGPSSVVDRLVALGHWPMAIEICNFLDFEPKNGVYKVLAHWCLTMMVTHKSKNKRNEGGGVSVDKLAQRIIGRLSKYPAISYADIAEMATRQELHDLANILLDKETNISRQVTVMLKMKQLERALKKAAQSQQPDLMHLVLKHLRHSENATDVELLLRKVPQAWSIYQSEIRNEAPDRLLALYEQNDDFVRQAIVYLMKAEQCHDIFDHSKIIEHLSKAERALRSMKDVSSAQLVSESVHLITENIKREEKYGMSMSHLSVRDTFILAAGHEEMSLMEQLKKQHRLNDKQIFLWTIEGFARAHKWQQLEQFVRFKKNSTLGNLPVIELCASHGNKNLALRFMDGINGYEEQIQAYLILGEVRKAATLAIERADVHMLQSIRRGFPTTSPHWTEVTKMMEDLIKNR